jgi:hypothetical protein
MSHTFGAVQSALVANELPSSLMPHGCSLPHPFQAQLRKDRRTRVLHLIETFDVGGTETQMVELALRMRSTSYDVTVACLSAKGPLRRVLERAGIPVVEFPKKRTLLSATGVYQLFRLTAFLRRGLGVVHAMAKQDHLFSVSPFRSCGSEF